jgi:glycosyltransferase involved in cell wall biosynthesis
MSDKHATPRSRSDAILTTAPGHEVRRRLRIAVAICTTGRPQTVRDCIGHLARQTRQPDMIWVCGASSDDVVLLDEVSGVVVLTSPKGVTIQRNRLIDCIGDQADILMFMDDDFLMHDAYLERVESLFSGDEQLVAVNGVTVADGIRVAGGYDFSEARKLLDAAVVPSLEMGQRKRIAGVYGCNFAVRQSAVLKHEIRFDERLPLYAWQEDIDFATRLSRFGVALQVEALGGVHLGVKGGRTSGVRFGYSQVSNTTYLALKGTMSPFYALKLISKNMAANLAGSVARDSEIDRRGRLRGNFLALQDVVLRRRVTPERILEL